MCIQILTTQDRTHPPWVSLANESEQPMKEHKTWKTMQLFSTRVSTVNLITLPKILGEERVERLKISQYPINKAHDIPDG